MGSTTLVEEVSKLVSDITGVQLGKRQAAMVESRLSRRMLQLGLNDPHAYLKYIYDHQESEVSALVSLLTTHHTNFFREFSHFEFLDQSGLQEVVAAARARGDKTIQVWSAACSRGHEVYSLSMFLDFHLRKIAPDFKYEILGSDVDPKSIEIAANGVYRWDDLKAAPSIYLASHWTRGTGEIASFVKAKPAIKSPCSFKVINLLDLTHALPGRKFDLIFCRNVFIYFTLEQIRLVSSNLLKHLQPNGFLFVGISETLNGTNLPIAYRAPSVYGHKGAAPTASTQARPAAPVARAPVAVASATSVPVLPAAPAATAASGAEKPIRVLCVDDSPTILNLLKKLLGREQGFEVVATAENGFEAAEKLKSLAVDVVTLDIHMPGQGGIEYLRKHMGPSHPPVVMVSSVSREDVELGLKSLELGAIDYVEKPSLADIGKRADEIRMKLRCAAHAGRGAMRGVLEVEKSFQKSHFISDPESKLRIIIAGIADREKLTSMAARMKGVQPPTLVLLQGAGTLLAGMQTGLATTAKLPVEAFDPVNCVLRASKIYVGDYQSFQETRPKLPQKKVSLLVFGDMAGIPLAQLTSGFPRWNLIVEDLQAVLSESHRALLAAAHRVVPFTSFLYHSDEYLSEDEGASS